MKRLFITILCCFSFLHVSQAKEIDMSILDKKEQATIAISALTANGDMDKLTIAFVEGLDAGLTISEIKEMVAHLYAYVGFPRSLNSQNLFMKIVEQREKAGKQDSEGKTASAKPKDYDAIEYGKKVRAQLVGIEKDYTGTAYQLFSPIIDEYLLGHLFGDIFVRDVLTFKQRELVTISGLAVLNGAESQLKFHMGAAMRVGNSKEELQEFIKVLEAKIDKQRASVASEVLEQVLTK